MDAFKASELREIANEVRRQADYAFPDTLGKVCINHCGVVRAVAGMIRRSFDLGAFRGGPDGRAGDRIAEWLVGDTNTIRLQDGIETPLWIPFAYYGVLQEIAPQLFFGELNTTIWEQARAAEKRREPGRNFLLHSAHKSGIGVWPLPGPVLKHYVKLGLPYHVYVTKAQIAAIADSIGREAARIGGEGSRTGAAAKPLSDSQQEAFNLIRAEGPITGAQIVRRLALGESSFTRHYVPALRAHGVKNLRDKRGYFIDRAM